MLSEKVRDAAEDVHVGKAGSTLYPVLRAGADWHMRAFKGEINPVKCSLLVSGAVLTGLESDMPWSSAVRHISSRDSAHQQAYLNPSIMASIILLHSVCKSKMCMIIRRS